MLVLQVLEVEVYFQDFEYITHQVYEDIKNNNFSSLTLFFFFFAP